jgi:hypothetical protein
VIFTSLAWATPDFPAALVEATGLPCDAGCILCHATSSGGPGTATQPFASSLIDAGTMPYDVPSLDAALEAMAADGTDSDGDGVGDVDELAAGDDPNGTASLCGQLTPTYGCFNTAGAAPAAGLLLGALAAGRRKGRRALEAPPGFPGEARQLARGALP